MKRRSFLQAVPAGLASGWPAVMYLGSPAEAASRDEKIPLWIDTDIGADIDDAVCLFCAIHHPRVELLGVSTVRGCIGSVRAAAWVADELLRRAGRRAVPVLPRRTATVVAGRSVAMLPRHAT